MKKTYLVQYSTTIRTMLNHYDPPPISLEKTLFDAGVFGSRLVVCLMSPGRFASHKACVSQSMPQTKPMCQSMPHTHKIYELRGLSCTKQLKSAITSVPLSIMGRDQWRLDMYCLHVLQNDIREKWKVEAWRQQTIEDNFQVRACFTQRSSR